MVKIAYNTCYGGFSLSRRAVLRGREISGDRNWAGANIKGDINDVGDVCDYDYGYVYDLKRTDPILIQVIEELGEDANGSHAKLAITEVPQGTPYSIDEYDGRERVETDYKYTEIAD